MMVEAVLYHLNIHNCIKPLRTSGSSSQHAYEYEQCVSLQSERAQSYHLQPPSHLLIPKL